MLLQSLKAFFDYRSWVISPPFKWSKIAQYDGESVIVAVTYARLVEDKVSRRLFFKHVTNINKHLEAAEGYIGSSLRMQPFGDDTWTVSVWRDEACMRKFVYSKEHATAMKEASKAMAEAKVAHRSMANSRLPLQWKEVFALLDEER